MIIIIKQPIVFIRHIKNQLLKNGFVEPFLRGLNHIFIFLTKTVFDFL
jgi:hypothetical protein